LTLGQTQNSILMNLMDHKFREGRSNELVTLSCKRLLQHCSLKEVRSSDTETFLCLISHRTRKYEHLLSEFSHSSGQAVAVYLLLRVVIHFLPNTELCGHKESRTCQFVVAYCQKNQLLYHVANNHRLIRIRFCFSKIF
jgi:hypothetical protein